MPRPAKAPRRKGRPLRGVSLWLIALAVALVATVQIRSEADVERTLASLDPTSLAFLIDDLHHANDSLDAEKSALNVQRASLRAGGTDAADQVLGDEAERLRVVEGLVAVHGPGVVIVIDASGLTALDLEDTLNNLSAAGAEAMQVNDRRVLMGLAITESDGAVTIDGVAVVSPWTISAIGDLSRLIDVASAMTQQLHADRRVRAATYAAEPDVVIRSTVSQKPFVYAVPA